MEVSQLYLDICCYELMKTCTVKKGAVLNRTLMALFENRYESLHTLRIHTKMNVQSLNTLANNLWRLPSMRKIIFAKDLYLQTHALALLQKKACRCNVEIEIL